jgi:integrase
MSGEPGSQDYLLGNFLVYLEASARDPANCRNKRVAISPGTATGSAAKVSHLHSNHSSSRRTYDLRHTHATLLLADREPVKTVSERLGHPSRTVTLAVYGHVMPGDQKRAADRFAALVGLVGEA